MNRLTAWMTQSLRIFGRGYQDTFNVQVVNRHPDPESLSDQCIVVIRSGQLTKHLVFKCPAGCGENLLLSLDSNKNPHWQIQVDWLGRPTLFPSVRHNSSCGGHFWIRKGRILWCHD